MPPRASASRFNSGLVAASSERKLPTKQTAGGSGGRTSSTNSAAFQLALWEILYETGPVLNVDGGDLVNRGVNYAKNPNTPAGVISQADTWLADLGSFSPDLGGLTTYRSAEHQDQISYQPVPEPSSWALIFVGLTTLAFMRPRQTS